MEYREWYEQVLMTDGTFKWEARREVVSPLPASPSSGSLLDDVVSQTEAKMAEAARLVPPPVPAFIPPPYDPMAVVRDSTREYERRVMVNGLIPVRTTWRADALEAQARAYAEYRDRMMNAMPAPLPYTMGVEATPKTRRSICAICMCEACSHPERIFIDG